MNLIDKYTKNTIQVTSSTNMTPIIIGGHIRWNSFSRGTGSSCADDACTEGPIFDVRRRELVHPVRRRGGGDAGRLLRRIAAGRAPALANRIGPGPYGLGTCVRQGPAARSSAVRNLGPLSIKFRLLTARLFIKPERHKLNMQNLINGMHARTGLPRASCAASPNTHGANSSSTA